MLKVKNSDRSAEIYLSGDIVDDTEGNFISTKFDSTDGYEFPKDLKRQLDEIKDKNLTIYINSYGGSVASGVAMANMIARHSKPTTAIVDGFCCSIATQIFFSADTCKMPINAYLMIHQPEVEISGNANDFRKAADTLDILQRGLETTYQKKKLDNVTNEEITEMMNQETWLTGEEAVKFFDIELLEPLKAMNCAGSLEKLKFLNYKNIPQNLKFDSIKTDEANQKIKIALARAKGALI